MNVGILSTGAQLAKKVMTNDDLAKIVDTSDEWIRTRTGIRERRIAGEGEATSVLSTAAAQQALETAGVSPEDVELVIVATSTPDMPFPATACLVQDNIGAKRAAAFDLGAGCTGFLYAMEVGVEMVRGGRKNVLVIGGECPSRLLNWEDRATCVLFGDGAGAVLLGPVEDGKGLLGSSLGSDGSGREMLKVPMGGSAMPFQAEGIAAGLTYIHMNGSEVFKSAVRAMARCSKDALEQAGVGIDELDWVVPHQANLRIIEALCDRLKVPMDKVMINLDRYGNMGSASVPVALDEGIRTGKFQPGQTVLSMAFGAGLTWGANVIRL